jgi:hypothetical protein
VAKGAAVIVGADPQKFRAVRTADVYAGIVERQTRQLDQLESELALDQEVGAESIVPITGERAFVELAARTVAREPAEIQCLAPSRLLLALAPAFRKRTADGAPFRVWSLAEAVDLPVTTEGTVSSDAAQALFGSPVALLSGGSAALLARLLERGNALGFWSSDPCLVGAARGAMAFLTGGRR